MTKIIIAILAGVVVLGGVYFAFIHSNKGIDTVTVEPQTTVIASQTPKKMAFSEFIKQSGAYKCVVNQDVAGVETKGTTYINNGMIRGEYNTKVRGMNIDSTLIVRDGYTYTWSSVAPIGYKVKIQTPTEGNTNTSVSTSGSYGFNAEQIGDYLCEPWTMDASKFAIPTHIKFQSL